MKIDVKTIKELAENLDKYKLNEIAVESEGVKLTLKKEKPMKNIEVIQPQQIIPQALVEGDAPVAEEHEEESLNSEYITAPMVGTFYTSSAPGNPAFVRVGTEVAPGETLCIIEAMKLLNEVKAHKACKIVKILVEDGQVVKKGDKLFAIE